MSEEASNTESGNEKPIYQKSLHPYDKTKKHWRKLRTEPYKVGDRIGCKLYGEQFDYFKDVQQQRGLTTTKFMSELLAITVQWTKAQIELGNKPFAPTNVIKYRGLYINDQEFADNVNFMHDYINSVRTYRQSYEHCLKDSIMQGLRLLWEYNIARKNVQLIGNYEQPTQGDNSDVNNAAHQKSGS